jgi:hypothetical protein
MDTVTSLGKERACGEAMGSESVEPIWGMALDVRPVRRERLQLVCARFVAAQQAVMGAGIDKKRPRRGRQPRRWLRAITRSARRIRPRVTRTSGRASVSESG